MNPPRWVQWWLFGALTGITMLSVERCAEIDRSPSGSCSSYGVEEQAIAMGLYLLVGFGLTTYAALPRRRPRSRSSPPPA